MQYLFDFVIIYWQSFLPHLQRSWACTQAGEFIFQQMHRDTSKGWTGSPPPTEVQALTPCEVPSLSQSYHCCHALPQLLLPPLPLQIWAQVLTMKAPLGTQNIPDCPRYVSARRPDPLLSHSLQWIWGHAPASRHLAAQTLTLLFHVTSLRKCKFKDKIMEDFKSIAEH